MLPEPFADRLADRQADLAPAALVDRLEEKLRDREVKRTEP